MVGRSKNSKRAAEHLENVSQLFQLLINVNRNMALHRKIAAF
jgi:hypothetical protein